MTHKISRNLRGLVVSIFLFHAAPAFAAPAVPDTGNTAWMMVSSLLVLMMTLPGLALFYGGLVKKDNVLATLMQSVTVCAAVSVVWPIIGYTLAFSGHSFYLGDFAMFMLDHIKPENMNGSIPESVFIMFQMTFAIITTALLVGAVADRIKFTSLLLFAPLWVVVVYAPVAHWVWGSGGFLGGAGLEHYEGFLGQGTAIDFAGGTVVHINSGIAGLVAAIVMGRSLAGAHAGPSTSNNLVMSVIGTGLLWVGWFGFNAGSALTAGASAGYAMLVTNSSAGMATIAWMIVELLDKKKASVQGALSGAVAGLVAITPAAGYVDFCGSLAIGLTSGALCYLAVSYLKHSLKYDDALDVFGIHGVGGIIGCLLTGVLANPDYGAATGWLYGNPQQLYAQILSIAVIGSYSAAMTFVLLKIVKAVNGLRVPEHVEYAGLDLELHGETVL